MKNVVATVIKFLVTGQQAAASALSSVSTAGKVATRSMATLAASVSSMGGTLGHAVGQVANFMMSVQQMGAVGGLISGAQMAISAICNHFVEAADEMLAAVERMGERVRKRLDELNKSRMDEVLKALDEATAKAREAASAFDALASSYLKVQAASDATAKSGSVAAESALALEKSVSMAGVSDDGQRALVGADYDIRIAKARRKAVEDEQDRSVEAAKDEAYVRTKQAKEAERAVRKAEIALKKAEEVYEVDVNANNDGNVEKSRKAKEDAEKALSAAINDRVRKEAEAQSASERIAQAENARIAAINDATRGIIDAEDAEKRLVEAQKKAAQAEIDRLNAEKKAESKVERAGDGPDRRAILEQIQSASSSRFTSAFELWRDPAAAQQAQDAAKKQDEDLKRFRKSVDRYGGKWRIDEAAELMRNGDEAGLQERLAEWRKSSKVNGQTEQMVLAAAAKQNENGAEKSLAAIRKTSDDINAKLAAIKAAFEGSEE